MLKERHKEYQNIQNVARFVYSVKIPLLSNYI